MKTRADIYRQEATELLRLISLYPGIMQSQLAGFFPDKDSTVITGLLSHLRRQGRVEQRNSSGWAGNSCQPCAKTGNQTGEPPHCSGGRYRANSTAGFS